MRSSTKMKLPLSSLALTLCGAALTLLAFALSRGLALAFGPDVPAFWLGVGALLPAFVATAWSVARLDLPWLAIVGAALLTTMGLLAGPALDVLALAVHAQAVGGAVDLLPAAVRWSLLLALPLGVLGGATAGTLLRQGRGGLLGLGVVLALAGLALLLPHRFGLGAPIQIATALCFIVSLLAIAERLAQPAVAGVGVAALMMALLPTYEGRLLVAGPWQGTPGAPAPPGEMCYLAHGASTAAVGFVRSGGHPAIRVDGRGAGPAKAEARAARILSFFHAAPKHALVHGAGRGFAAGAFVDDPRVENISLLEAHPLHLEALRACSPSALEGKGLQVAGAATDADVILYNAGGPRSAAPADAVVGVRLRAVGDLAPLPAEGQSVSIFELGPGGGELHVLHPAGAVFTLAALRERLRAQGGGVGPFEDEIDFLAHYASDGRGGTSPLRLIDGLGIADAADLEWRILARRELRDVLREAAYQLAAGNGGSQIPALENAARAHPDDAQLRLALGRAYEAGGHYESAAASHRVAAELAGEGAQALQVEALIEHGKNLYTLRRDDEAQQALNRAAQMAPLHPGPHRYLGLIENVRGRPEAARRHLEHALRLDPGDYEARRYLAQIP